MGSFSDKDAKIPEIYVLWHPRCELGEAAARRVYAWLRPGKGLGPHVFYRSLPAPGAAAGRLPLALPGDPRSSAAGNDKLQIVLPLIDEHMIADASWRYWLELLGGSSGQARVVLPVAVDSTAFNVPETLRALNFLRPAGLPISQDAADRQRSEEVAIRSLLKQLTEALCRIAFGGLEAGANATGCLRIDGTAPKIKLFLSHAKVDGRVPAQRLRDYLYQQTQIAAFYDENDIPFGSAFPEVLRQDVTGPQTAALIAFRTAQYASRPWCRTELSLFRTPKKRKQEPMEAGQNERWHLLPVLVVDALERGESTLGIWELGDAPMIRWAPDADDQAELVVTTILRDAFLSAFHAGVGRKLGVSPNRIVLNWIPDPTTLLRIDRVRAGEALEVAYPGRGLSGRELDMLDDLFPHVLFRSFEGHEHSERDRSLRRRHRGRGLDQRLVAFSVSHEREPLLARGLGLPHLQDLIERLARPLLRNQASLAYAGAWGETESNFTHLFLRLISAEQEDNSVGGADTSLRIGRLVNHSAWPHYVEITPRIEAQWINSCRIIRVRQEDAGIAPENRVADDARSGSDRAILNAALTLGAMRRIAMQGTEIESPDVPKKESIPRVSARIVLGGKLTGFSGFMPGIFEEVLVALEAGCPLYLIGGFGGATEVLTRVLLSTDLDRPEEMTVPWLEARTPKLHVLRTASATLPVPADTRTTEVLLDALHGRLVAARGGLEAALGTGLDDDAETRELLATCDPLRAAELVQKGLRKRFGFPQAPA